MRILLAALLLYMTLASAAARDDGQWGASDLQSGDGSRA
jgi:hypothetical protein